LDASGKDGAIRKVFGTMNPQGVNVRSFKVPTEEEKAHDFLWRIHHHVPGKSMIQIFNRSHYEDVLVTRVHGWCDDATAQKRFDAINDFEKMLSIHNSTHILKFYLHVSREEQQERLQERLEDPTKHWKFNEKDMEESKLYEKYIAMYEDVFKNCDAVPWHIVPADQNWYKEYFIAKTMVDTLDGLKMKYPQLKRERFVVS
jgi:PPK2 family polyphosphate:nucleotide phosphotransferase